MASAQLSVRLIPRARADEIAGSRGDAVLIRVTAPPVDGRANEALRALIAKRAGVAKGRVSIVAGTASRDKVVRVEGIEPDALARALGVGDTFASAPGTSALPTTRTKESR